MLGKIFGIALVFVMVGSMPGGSPVLVEEAGASPGTIYVLDNYSTIQTAADAVSRNDTIIARDDTYGENVDMNKNLALHSDNETVVSNWTCNKKGIISLSAIEKNKISDQTIFGISGETIFVSLKLLSIPSTLAFDRDFVPDYYLEYQWSIYIDSDNNPNTGSSSYPAEGCDVSLSLMNFKFPNSTQYNATIIEGTQHNTWVCDETYCWYYGHEIDAAVDYPNNTIKMMASKAWEELSDVNENSRFCFVTSCYIPDGVMSDKTSFSSGSNIITDPEGDVSYDFIDIIQGNLLLSKTWYVDDDRVECPDANFTKIQEAVDNATAGDTIVVYPGTYTENVDVNKDHLTIRSESGAESTIVQAAGSYDHVFQVTADYVNISGVTTEGATQWPKAGIYLNSANHCSVFNNIVLNNHFAIYLHMSDNNEIRNNLASDNGGDGIMVSYGSDSNKIIKNILSYNYYWGIYFDFSNNNLVYLNNFINSGVVDYAGNVYSDEYSTNSWNSPEEITYTYNGSNHTNYLGNYWDDYTGADVDGDGIGEISYIIKGGYDYHPVDYDYYPLMEPFENYQLGPPPTDTTPPAKVTDLAISETTASSINLNWTAPGDDGNVGTASEYDIRYSTSQMNESSWASANQCADEPPPQVAGSPETFTVTGLSPNTTYYFALKTADEVPNWSGLSNVVNGTTTVHKAPTAWQLKWIYESDSTPSSVSVSSDGNYIAVGSNESVYLLDSGKNLLWTYPANLPITDVTMTANVSDIMAGGSKGYPIPDGVVYQLDRQGQLKSSFELNGVSSVSLSPHGSYFAMTYMHWLGWNDIVTVWGFNEGKWLWDYKFGQEGTAAVSISTGGSYIAVGGAGDVWGEPGELRLYGKDGSLLWKYVIDTGTLQGGDYSVSISSDGRYVAVGNEDNDNLYFFDSEGQLVWEYNTGDIKGVSVSGDGNYIVAASNDKVYLFDREGNLLWTSEIEKIEDVSISTEAQMVIVVTEDNKVYAYTPGQGDTTLPANVTDLAVSGTTTNSINLSWHAPGDDGNTGTASEYDIRYSTSQINETNWALANQCADEPPPQVAGSAQTFTVTGLSPNTTYYFALKTADEVPNWSGLSNVVNGTTVANNAPTANASDISGQPEIMYPYTDYSVTAKYYDPDGRDDLKYCYLQLKRPGKPLTMMWYQSDGSYSAWAGEEGANYLTINDVTNTIVTDGYEGYQLTWNFSINESWPEAENSIDFGVCAKDDSDVSSGFDYDNSDSSFFTIPDTPEENLLQLVYEGGYRVPQYSIPVGEKTFEDSVAFKANVSNPGGGEVKLQIELRRLDEDVGNGEGKFIDEFTQESALVSSGSEAFTNATELINATYHWQARTVSEYGVNSTWVEFGHNDIKEADFTVPPELELAKKFSPVLYIHPSDYQPKDARMVVENATLGSAIFAEKRIPWTLLRCWEVESTKLLENNLDMEKLVNNETFPFGEKNLQKHKKMGYFFDLPGDPASQGDTKYQNNYNALKDQYPTVTYARITAGWDPDNMATRVIVQYYFMYYYNHWPVEQDWNIVIKDWDDHEWDCELIELVFPSGPDISQILEHNHMPEFAVYSVHSDIPAYSYGRMKRAWSEVGKVGSNHPKVYVAQGGHPNYFTAGTFNGWTIGHGKARLSLGVDRRYDTPNATNVTPDVVLLPGELKAGEKYNKKENLNERYWWPMLGWAKYEGRWGEVDKNLALQDAINLGLYKLPSGLSSGGWCGYPLVTHKALTDPWGFYDKAGESAVRRKILNVVSLCPVSIGVYDAAGHHIGPNETGMMEFEIPGAVYITSEDTQFKAIIIPNADISENYTVEVKGTDTGTFNLSMVIADQGNDVQHGVSYDNVSVNLNATGKVELNPERNFTLHMDYDGDGVYETDVPPTQEETINVTDWPKDVIPPGNITDLHVTGATAESLTLNWTAPGNDGYNGTAMAYELKYSTSPMTEESWYSAIQYPDAPIPQAGNTTEVCTVYGLEPGTTYYFALMAADDEWNWGDLSNIASGTTELGATLEGHVNFSGRGSAPDDRWIQSFNVTLFESGNLTNELWTGNAITSNTGVFTIGGLTPGTYDIGIKNATCLSELVTNVTLTTGETEVVNFTIREGDVHPDDYVDMGDYADFSYAFRTSPTDAKWNANADLDRSGYVDMGDYAMFSYNFREIGDAYGCF